MNFYEISEQSNDKELLIVLESLIKNWESEVVEFKEATNDFDKNKIGQYFSAISNEANLKQKQYGWLVFGVRNKGKQIVGSDYRDTHGLDILKQEISEETTGNISYIDIFEIYPETNNERKRVIMFQIPAAITATPTAWKGHYYGRNGESLGPLSVEELERIRGQEKKDWSKQILENATISDLDVNALKIAREKYKEKMNRPHISEEVDGMSDEEFLTKIKLMVDGRITNAAMLLLGNEDKDYLFASAPEAAWRVYNSKEDISDYAIFKIPYITLSDRIFGKIRNLTYRYMPNQMTLFPLETTQYDMWLLRELLNNCIAHSEYTIGGRIYVNEFEDRLNLYISASVAKSVEQEADYIRKKGFDDQYYKDMIVKYLEQFGKAQKKDIKMLLCDKLPEILDDKQKDYKIRNLLASMKKAGIIKTDSENQQRSYWILDK